MIIYQDFPHAYKRERVYNSSDSLPLHFKPKTSPKRVLSKKNINFLKSLGLKVKNGK